MLEASGGQDGAVILWSRGRILRRELRNLDSPVECVSFSPSGRLVAAGSRDGHLAVWRARSGRLVYRLPSAAHMHMHQLAFSPDGRAIATCGSDASIRLFKTRSGVPLRRLTLGDFAASDADDADDAAGEFFSLAFSPAGALLSSGALLAAALHDGRIFLWDLSDPSATHPLRALPGHPAGTLCLAFTSDGKRLLSGGRDGSISVWDTLSGTALFHVAAAHTAAVQSLAISLDTLVATGGDDCAVRVWRLADAATAQENQLELLQTFVGHSGHVNDVSFSAVGEENVAPPPLPARAVVEAPQEEEEEASDGDGYESEDALLLPKGGGGMRVFDAQASGKGRRGSLVPDFEVPETTVRAEREKKEGKRSSS